MTRQDGPPLRVGVDLAPPPPMCFGVPDTPEFRGFEVDLLHALCERLGRPLHAEAALWADLLARLDGPPDPNRALDLICTAVTVTPERRRTFAFSRPYLRMSLALICRRDRPVRALADGLYRVAVRIGTPAEVHARQARTQAITTLHFNDEIYRALADDGVDVAVDDHPIGAWFAAQSPALTVGARVPGTESSYSLVLRRDDRDLQAAVDRALQDIFRDGTYRAAYDTWMTPIVGDACDVTRPAVRYPE